MEVFEENKEYFLDLCKFIPDDNFLKNIKQSPEVARVILENAIAAFNSSRCDLIYSPIPLTWIDLATTHNFDEKKRITNLKNILVLNLDIEFICEVIEKSITEVEIYNKLGHDTYTFVKFTLGITNIQMVSYEFVSFVEIMNEVIKTKNGDSHTTNLETINNFKNNFQQFQILHTPIKESLFKDKKTLLLFHGSPRENWYRITSDRIRNCSNTKLQIHGNVYGNGIYASDDPFVSTGYCGRYYSNNTGNNTDKKIKNSVLAIYEVLENKEKNNWNKSHGIYVIDDENALILRFLFTFNSENSNFNNIVFNIIKKKMETNQAYSEYSNKKKEELEMPINMVRLKKEYMKTKKIVDSGKCGYTFNLKIEDNLTIWIIDLQKVDNEKLQLQMQKLNIPHITIEIEFKPGYPHKPPFVRILNPRFKQNTGHITLGGSICMELLSNQGWNPIMTIDSLINQIKLVMCDGAAEIDEINFKNNSTYNYENAIEAHKRAMETHRWV